MRMPATKADAFSKGESGSNVPVDVSIWTSSDHCDPGPNGKGRGYGGWRVMVNVSGKFRARANDEKLVDVSPRPGRKTTTFVGRFFDGRQMTGCRSLGRSSADGMVGMAELAGSALSNVAVLVIR